MPVSIRDVAQRAGVSVGTVSNVLNRPDEVSSDSVERVTQAIDELGYVRNDAARKLRAGVSTTVGFVVLDGQNPFYTDVVRGAEDEATRHGIAILYGNTDEDVSRERLYIDLYKDAERKHFLTGLNTYQAASGTQSFVLRKGTYYVSLSDSAISSHVRFSLCVLKDYGNYCPARAVTLQRGVKAIQGGHTPLNSFEYDWFKVRLTRKQRITVRCSTNCSFVAFRDTAMKKLDGESTTKKAYRTRDVLGPGTYYLRVNNYGIYNAFATRANTIWWK